MVDLGGFDASTVEPFSGDFETIPKGSYKAIIVESAEKDTKAQNGTYLALQWQIVEGKYENRRVFSNITRTNPSEKAVNIGKGQLSSICRAVNVLKPKDSHDLHDLPVMIKIDHEMYEGKTKEKITSYKSTKAVVEDQSDGAVQVTADSAPWMQNK